MKPVMAISLRCTSLCNGGCRYCSVRPWMDYHGSWQMTMREVKDLIRCSRESGYRYDKLSITGGEPLLWDHLEDACRLLTGSGLIQYLKVETNGLLLDREHRSLLLSVASSGAKIHVSSYKGNEDNVAYARSEIRNVVVNKASKVRSVTPDDPVPDSLPSDCGCNSYGYSRGMVDICSPVRTMGMLPPENGARTSTIYSVPLKPKFLDAFRGIDKFTMPACSICISNRKVARVVRKVRNSVL